MEMSTRVEIGWKSMLGGQVYGKPAEIRSQTIFGY